MTGMRGRVWRGGRTELVDFPLEDLDAHLADPDTVVWLDLVDPDPGRLALVAEELGLDPQAIEDAVAPGERPKATTHSSHTFLTVYGTRLVASSRPRIHESRLAVARVSAFVMATGLITVRRGDDFDMDAVLARWEADRPLLAEGGVDALVHGLLDLVVDGHVATLAALDDTLEALEDSLFDDRASTRETQQRVFGARKELVELRRVVLPMREVVTGVMRHRERAGALESWYQDLYDHVLRATEWTDALRDMVASLFETNLALQDARLNTVMKKLAGWAAVIAVPTAVTGWFGMNVPYPGYGNQAGLAATAVLTFGGSALVYAMLRRVDWL